VLVLKYGPTSFGEFPVECCIMSNDDVCVSDETIKGYGVDLLPGYHLFSDAGQLDDFRRDDRSRLIEGLENAGDAGDLIAVRVAEFHHCHLDDFVLDGVKAGCLKIDDDCDFPVAVGRRGRRLPRDETTQDPVVARGFELTGTIFIFFVLSLHRVCLGLGARVEVFVMRVIGPDGDVKGW
jgi:hypothetical protein